MASPATHGQDKHRTTKQKKEGEIRPNGIATGICGRLTSSQPLLGVTQIEALTPGDRSLFFRRLSTTDFRPIPNIRPRFRLTNGRPKESGFRSGPRVERQKVTIALRKAMGIIVNRCDINSVQFLTFCLGCLPMEGTGTSVTWPT